jgi:hypothetical protein
MPLSDACTSHMTFSPFITYVVEFDEVYRLQANGSLAITVSITKDSADVLLLVTDPHLCRVQNKPWKVHFQGFNAESRRFRLNSRKAYEDPTDSEDTDTVTAVEHRSKAVDKHCIFLERIIHRVQEFAVRLHGVISLYSSSIFLNLLHPISFFAGICIPFFHDTILIPFGGGCQPGANQLMWLSV